MTEHDAVNHPSHYTEHPSGVECISVVEHMGFNLGNVIKYVWRADSKGAPLEDLAKAKWYLEREIARRHTTVSVTRTPFSDVVVWVSNDRCTSGDAFPHGAHPYGAVQGHWCDGAV